jgi:hypothetical protein
MGWRTQNIKSRIHSIANSSDAVLWNPKKGYFQSSLRSIMIKGIMIPIIALSPLSYFLHSTKASNLNNYEASQKIENPYDIQSSQKCDPETKSCTDSSTIEQKVTNIVERKDVIREDILEKSGTVFPGTTTLRYTEKGIVIPKDFNYSVIVNGTEYFPNSEGFIELPERVLGEKVRFAKIDPEIKDSKTKYLASFSTKIKIETSEETKYLATNKSIKKNSPAKTLEDKITTTQNYSYNLESISQDDSIYQKGNTKNISNAIFASTDPSLIEYDPIQEAMNKYSTTRKQRQEITAKVIEGLNSGYKINSVRDSLKNKDGSMRSDTAIVTKMKYNNQSFDDFIYNLVIIEKMSLKDAADSASRCTTYFFTDTRTKMRVNTNQIKAALARKNCFPDKDVEKNPQKYQGIYVATRYGNR